MDFVIEQVEGGWPASRGVSLACSPTGVVAIAEERGRYLYLVELQNGEEIGRELVDRFVRRPALAADASGHYHLTYWNGRRKAVMYATNASGQWVAEEIYQTMDSFIRPRIAVDASGAVHIAFYDGSAHFDGPTSEAFYATNESGRWMTESVPIAVDNFIQLACDEAGVCYIVFYDIDEKATRIAARHTAGWEVETIDALESPSGQQIQSIAIDPSGAVHVVFSKGDGLLYATNPGGVWRVESVGPLYAGDPTIGITPSGGVYILYWDEEIISLRLATIGDDGWESVSIPGQYNGYLSIDSDPEGNLHVAFKGIVGEETDLTGGLVYADEESGWNPRLLDQGSRVGRYAALSITKVGYSQIAHQDSQHGTLRFSSNETDEWISETPDDTIKSGQYLSVCSDKVGGPHTVHMVNIKDDSEGAKLRYHHRVNGAWVMEDIVEEGRYTALEPTGIAVDTLDRVHVVFREWWESPDQLNFESTIMYALREVDGTWNFETVYWSEGQAGDELCLILDSEEIPHVAFSDYAHREVKQAVRRGDGSWGIETAAADLGDRTRGVSLAVDDTGNAYISFLHETAVDAGLVTLELATDESGVWERGTLDECTSLLNNSKTSISVDDEGFLHLSYVFIDAFDPGLRYITNKSGDWIKADIDTAGWVGEYNSLKIDRFGLVHIAYEGEDALWHARFPAGQTDAVLVP